MTAAPLTRTEEMQALLAEVIYAKQCGPALARKVQCLIGGWHRYTPSQVRSRHPGFVEPGEWIGDHADGSPICDQMHGTTIHRDVPDVIGSVDAAMELFDRVCPKWFMGMERFSDGWYVSVGEHSKTAPRFEAYQFKRLAQAITVCALKVASSKETTHG